jgi:hypothetical protein
MNREQRITFGEMRAGRRHPAAVKKLLSSREHHSAMRVAMATMVALLVLNFVDEHFNNAHYTKAAKVVVYQIARSFG